MRVNVTNLIVSLHSVLLLFTVVNIFDNSFDQTFIYGSSSWLMCYRYHLIYCYHSFASRKNLKSQLLSNFWLCMLKNVPELNKHNRKDLKRKTVWRGFLFFHIFTLCSNCDYNLQQNNIRIRMVDAENRPTQWTSLFLIAC